MKIFFAKKKFVSLQKMEIPPMPNIYSYENWMDNRVIGYFQLFHYSDFGCSCIFPELYDDEIGNCNNAAFYDDVFSFNYRGKQAYIDDIQTIHLPHDANNWDGRVTQKLPYNILKDIQL